MRQLIAATLCFVTATGLSQKNTSTKAAKKLPYFIQLDRLPLLDIIPPPPDRSSDTERREFVELHSIQDRRTPEQIKAAQSDDVEEDIFIFRTVFGAGFESTSLPLTAALGSHLHNDEPIAGNPLKTAYARPRPYQIDSTLHPVCKTTTQHNAYPSGHTISDYLFALALSEMIPEKRDAILERAKDYANNRLVCGVHTASDLEASRLLAYAVFGSLLQTPKFQQDLSAARTELRQALQLN